MGFPTGARCGKSIPCRSACCPTGNGFGALGEWTRKRVAGDLVIEWRLFGADLDQAIAECSPSLQITTRSRSARTAIFESAGRRMDTMAAFASASRVACAARANHRMPTHRRPDAEPRRRRIIKLSRILVPSRRCWQRMICPSRGAQRRSAYRERNLETRLTPKGRPPTAVDVGYPMAQVEGPLSCVEIARTTGASRTIGVGRGLLSERQVAFSKSTFAEAPKL